MGQSPFPRSGKGDCPFFGPAWAARLKRVFAIDIEQCARCGGRLKVLASIEDPEVIARTLAHRRERGDEDPPVASRGARAPPPGMSGMLF